MAVGSGVLHRDSTPALKRQQLFLELLSPWSGPLPPSNPQVLAPLLRRFMALRTRLLDNDRTAKKRLDLAAEHLK